jgi:Protein of unknown function (DUF3108)
MARRLSLSTGRLLALVAVVLGLHALVADRVADAVVAWQEVAALPARLQVAYVREMEPSEPPLAARPAVLQPAAARAPRAAGPVSEQTPPPAPPAAASAPALEPAMEAAPEAAPAMAGAPEADFVVAADSAAPGEAAASASAVDDEATATANANAISTAQAQATDVPALGASQSFTELTSTHAGAGTTTDSAGKPFTWPASTRLSYRLTGQYRGEVHGRAQVEWVLAAPRYQVHLDVSVGLPIAPLFSRKMSSDGRLTAAGLRPERYDEVSQMAFRERRQQHLLLQEDGVRLADGRRWSPPADAAPAAVVQDSASQFVQLSYLFTVNPGLLAPGQTISFPLALPRRVEPWVYEVVGAATQFTPFGALETFHVRPRPGTPRGNDLLAEAWFAPQLAYLPVRIRIEQDAEVFIDLVLDRRPELAAAVR